MKRDMDLVRRIALETEQLPFGQELTGLDGVDKATFGMHVIWMVEAGLLTAKVQEFISAGDPPKVFVRRLTWEGCEFLEAARNETLWRKAKETVLKPSASFTFGLLREWLATEIREGFPTLRG
jgi:hypothetical protein